MEISIQICKLGNAGMFVNVNEEIFAGYADPNAKYPVLILMLPEDRLC